MCKFQFCTNNIVSLFLSGWHHIYSWASRLCQSLQVSCSPASINSKCVCKDHIYFVCIQNYQITATTKKKKKSGRSAELLSGLNQYNWLYCCQRTFTGCASSWDFRSDYNRTMHIFKPISFLASSLCWQARGPWGSCLIKWINHWVFEGLFFLLSPICNLTCHLFLFYLADPRNWRWRAISSTGARSRISQFPVIRVKRKLMEHQHTKWILEVHTEYVLCVVTRSCLVVSFWPLTLSSVQVAR